MREGQKRKSERKFFPGYVLVQMEMDDETWHLVKDVPRVMGFIGGTGDRPVPITDREAQAILSVCRKAPRSRGRRYCSSRARWSALRTDRSTISMASSRKSNYEKSRLRVAVLIFGRSTPVELEFGQVEKA